MFEDKAPFRIGMTDCLGSHIFDAEAIIAFARKYDPQPFHTDVEAARQSLLGGLCASGWHTAGIWMRLYVEHIEVDHRRQAEAGEPLIDYGPSPGVRNLVWFRPVFAGDTITFFRRVDSVRPSTGKPGWWIMSVTGWGDNQAGQSVIRFENGVLARPQA